MIDPIIQLCIIVLLVLSVNLFDLGVELEHLLVNHQFLNAVPHVVIFVDVRPGRIKGGEDHTFGGHISHD